jgi:flagellar biosynthesis GTPase FlhF
LIAAGQATSFDDQAEARPTLEGLTVKLDGERRGHGQAVGAEAERRRERAERRAADLEEAMETERAAEARRTAAEATRRAQEDELAAAKAEADAKAERTRAAEAEMEEERQKAVKAQAILDAQRAEAEAEVQRARAAEVRRQIAVLEAEAATADDYAHLTLRQRKARKVARMILAAGGSVGHVDVVALSDIEAAVGVGRTVAGDIRKEAQELLAAGYDPTTDYTPQTDH